MLFLHQRFFLTNVQVKSQQEPYKFDCIVKSVKLAIRIEKILSLPVVK